jgi:SAM-dependent methyltransferase
MNWTEYWSNHNISGIFWEKNLELYCRNLIRKIPLSKDCTILDYGSGAGYAAKYLAPRVNEIHLIEPSEILLEQSKAINKDNQNIIHYLLKDVNALKTDYSKDRFDIVLINSVLQYIPPAQVRILLEIFHHILKSNGKIVISDIAPKNSLMLKDVLDFLRFCRRTGTLIDFIRFSIIELKKITKRSGLTYWTYSKEELERLFPAVYTIAWVENPTALSDRMCAILSKNGFRP